MFRPMPLPDKSVKRPPRLRLARWFAGLGGFAVLVALGAWLLRFPLAAAALTAGLQRAGAGDIKFTVAAVSPWQVEVDDLAFRIKTQRFSAHRVTAGRDHWWQSTLGALRIEGARVPVVIDGSDANPRAWASYSGQQPASGAITLPADQVSIDGVLAVQAASLAEQPLAVDFAARQAASDTWAGTLHVTGAGLAVEAEASYALKSQRLAFHTTSASLDLKAWQDFIQRIIVMPGGAWELAGRLSGHLEGGYADGKLAMGGAVKLENGSVANSLRNFSVAGIEADLEFSNFSPLQSKPGTLKAHELHSGDLVANDLAFELAFSGSNQLDVNRASLRILGGSLTSEPFRLQLDREEIEATVLADGLDIAAILALSKDVPGAATGRVNGRLPIRIDSAGLRFGTGWLELKKGIRAEVQLRAAGLLTGGVSQSSASYAMLKKVETGMTRLQVTELRIDVRPPNAPPGRSAQLHIVGEPVDPNLKAPVTLDLNINGPLEQLINLSLDKRVSFGPGK
jgi:hypothetical protein